MAKLKLKDGGRDTNINLRANTHQKALIDQAAKALGKTRSEFMLDVSCREAEAVMLDKVYFALSPEKFAEFKRRLEAPTPNAAGLRELLHQAPPWQE